jgi:hypothetical protein
MSLGQAKITRELKKETVAEPTLGPREHSGLYTQAHLHMQTITGLLTCLFYWLVNTFVTHTLVLTRVQPIEPNSSLFNVQRSRSANPHPIHFNSVTRNVHVPLCYASTFRLSYCPCLHQPSRVCCYSS